MIAIIATAALLAAVKTPAKATPREVWVSSAVTVSGNGSERRPYKTMAEALSLGAVRIHLSVGSYRGPFDLTEDVEISGTSGVPVLYVDGGASAVFRSADHRLTLRSVSVNGGSVGIDCNRANLSLDTVTVGGQREIAVRLRGGSLQATSSILEAAVSETRGLVLEDQARAQVSDLTVRGPFRRGWEVKSGSQIEAEKPIFQQVVTAIHQVSGRVLARGLIARGGRGPAIYASRGELNLETVVIHGHEYALQTGEKAVLKINGFTSFGAERAAFGLVRASGTLTDILAVESGDFGGMQILDSSLTIEHFVLRSPESYGLNARQSELVLRDGLITDVRDRAGHSGDGLHLRRSKVTMKSVTVRGCAGVGVLAAEASAVSLDDFLMENCKYAGIAAETLAQVEASSVIIRDCRGPAIAVPGEAEVRVDGIDSTRNSDGVVWAECQRSARVLLAHVRSDVELQRSRCVHSWAGNRPR